MMYQYECDCATWERQCKVADRDKIVGRICKHCESEIRRVVTSSTFILKEGGCGWANSGYSGTLGGAMKSGGGFKSE